MQVCILAAPLRPSDAGVPPKVRGRREGRVQAAPMARQQVKKLAAVTTGLAERPAFPAQWFYGFLRALPRDRAFLPLSRADRSAHLASASGGQDHATLPYALAPFVRTKTVRAANASIASRPACRDDSRSAPLPGQDGRIMLLICRIGKRAALRHPGATGNLRRADMRQLPVVQRRFVRASPCSFHALSYGTVACRPNTRRECH